MLIELLKIFWPYLLNLSLSRLILQTDLIMLSAYGADVVAAFAAPSGIMVIDQILAFSLVPVLAVRIAQKSVTRQIKSEISVTIWQTLVLSLAITLLGILVYPVVAEKLITAPRVVPYAKQFVMILTLSIPLRFLQFSSGVALHALKRGKLVVQTSIMAMVLNFLLNDFLMFRLNLGPAGCYYSTILVNTFIAAKQLYHLRWFIDWRDFHLSQFVPWLMDRFHSVKFEALRITSEKLMMLLAFAAINWSFTIEKTAGYSIANEAKNLFAVLSIALMRAAAIYFATLESSMLIIRVKKMLLQLMCMGTIIGGLVFVMRSIVYKMYHLDSPATEYWVNIFLLFTMLGTGIESADALLRGLLQSMDKFNITFKIDALLGWCVFIPMFIAGSLLNSPYVVWGSYFLMQLMAFVWLYRSAVLSERMQACNNDG